MTRSRKPERIRQLDAALGRLADAERRLRQAAAEHLGMGISDLETLLLLAESGPQAAGRLAEALALTTGAVTGLADRLERQGWIERARHDADRRQVLIELAAAKRPAIAALRASREQALVTATADDDDDAIETAARVVDAAAERIAIAAGALATPATDGGADDAGDRAPIGTIEDATLRFTSGATRLELRGARIRDLYRAVFHGRRPLVSVDRGVLAIQYKGLSWWRARDAAELTLTSAVSWAIEIGRGASQLTLDLRELHLRSIDITGGASECNVRLPRPRGAVAMRIKGGASHVVLRRPRGVAVQAIVRGGANSLALDDQSVGSIGSTARLATPGWEEATDRWSIELTGGASHLAISEE